MKKFYTPALMFLLCLQAGLYTKTNAQCVDGSAPKPVILDTTIYFEPGVSTTQVKFPQFDPENGMLRCVKLTTTMTGIIDTVAMQNLSTSTQTAKFDYKRNDQMKGPGLRTPLGNDFSKQYGPYQVTKFDGNFHSGTDVAAIPHDTVLRKTVVRTLTDSTEISQFYGKDSVTYDYNISVSTIAAITGGSSSNMVLTSANVNFKFEYCTCGKVTLPVGLKNFTATKTAAQNVNLSWEGENDEYSYEYDVEVSRDGKNFLKVATVNRKYVPNPKYLYSFTLKGNEYGKYYYRVRQHWQNGYVRYTAIKSVDMANPLFATTTLYPNPANGMAGIKFVNVKGGKMLVQVTNAGGQPVMQKELQVAETDYKVLGSLPAGTYWVKITDIASTTTAVKQLIVQ